MGSIGVTRYPDSVALWRLQQVHTRQRLDGCRRQFWGLQAPISGGVALGAYVLQIRQDKSLTHYRQLSQFLEHRAQLVDRLDALTQLSSMRLSGMDSRDYTTLRLLARQVREHPATLATAQSQLRRIQQSTTLGSVARQVTTDATQWLASLQQVERQPAILFPLARLKGIQTLLGRSEHGLKVAIQQSPQQILHELFKRTALGNTSQWAQGLSRWLIDLQRAQQLSHRLNAGLAGGAVLGMFMEINAKKQSKLLVPPSTL